MQCKTCLNVFGIISNVKQQQQQHNPTFRWSFTDMLESEGGANVM